MFVWCEKKLSIYACMCVCMHKYICMHVRAGIFTGNRQEGCHLSQEKETNSLTWRSSSVNALLHSSLTHSRAADASSEQCTGRVGTRFSSGHFILLHPRPCHFWNLVHGTAGLANRSLMRSVSHITSCLSAWRCRVKQSCFLSRWQEE